MHLWYLEKYSSHRESAFCVNAAFSDQCSLPILINERTSAFTFSPALPLETLGFLTCIVTRKKSRLKAEFLVFIGIHYSPTFGRDPFYDDANPLLISRSRQRSYEAPPR
jgi:hypothetical protein